MAGTAVFIDLNGDNQLDADEPSGITDANGYFNIEPFTAVAGFVPKIIFIGGTDSKTGAVLYNLALVSDVPLAGAMLVNDFAADPELDPFYAGSKYLPVEDNDADGVLNHADMFLEDSTKSADLDYDGVPDEVDVSDDRVKFDNLNFECPDAFEPSRRQCIKGVTIN